MDFIERVFHVSPDGGDGSLELLWLGVAALAICALALRRRASRAARRRAPRPE